MLCNGLNIADNKRNGYFAFQALIDSLWCAAPFLSFDVVCVSSPVIIILFTYYTKKMVFSTRSRDIDKKC